MVKIGLLLFNSNMGSGGGIEPPCNHSGAGPLLSGMVNAKGQEHVAGMHTGCNATLAFACIHAVAVVKHEPALGCNPEPVVDMLVFEPETNHWYGLLGVILTRLEPVLFGIF